MTIKCSIGTNCHVFKTYVHINIKFTVWILKIPFYLFFDNFTHVSSVSWFCPSGVQVLPLLPPANSVWLVLPPRMLTILSAQFCAQVTIAVLSSWAESRLEDNSRALSPSPVFYILLLLPHSPGRDLLWMSPPLPQQGAQQWLTPSTLTSFEAAFLAATEDRACLAKAD